MERILGRTLLTADVRPIATADALRDKKYIGIYFSALWCMPCRSFTPMLKAAYEQLRALGGEVVFVSSDRDETKYIEYFQAMPWLALPYADRERKMNLASRFRVATIPRLIVLDGDGNLITLHGRTDLPNDPQLGGFPWRVRPASEILRSARLLDAHNSPVALPGSSRTVVALYFTCLRTYIDIAKPLTQRLLALYRVLREHGRAFEVVWVSLDTEQSGYDMQRAAMPWPALPFGDTSAQELTKIFDVRDTPAVVVIEFPSGTVLNHLHAIEALLSDDTGKAYPWPQPPAARFGALTADVLNRAAAVVFFLPPSGTSSDSRGQSSQIRRTSSLNLSPEDAKAVGEFEAFALARTDVAYRSAQRDTGTGWRAGAAADLLAASESGGGSASGSSASGSSAGGSSSGSSSGGSSGSSAGSAGSASAAGGTIRSIVLNCGNDSRTGGSPPPAFLYGVPDAITTQVLAWARISDAAPLVAIIDFPTKVKYVWPLASTDDVTVESLNDFLTRYEEGRLRPEPLR